MSVICHVPLLQEMYSTKWGACWTRTMKIDTKVEMLRRETLGKKTVGIWQLEDEDEDKILEQSWFRARYRIRDSRLKECVSSTGTC